MNLGKNDFLTKGTNIFLLEYPGDFPAGKYPYLTGTYTIKVRFAKNMLWKFPLFKLSMGFITIRGTVN